MGKKEDFCPKLIFPLSLILVFSIIYLLGPGLTGFHIYDSSGISNNFVLFGGLIFFLVLIFVVLIEIMVKLR